MRRTDWEQTGSMSYVEVSRRHSTLHIMEREPNILISLRTALAVTADGLSA